MLNAYGDIHMTKIKALFLGSALSLATIGLAQADTTTVTGAWKLSTGVADAPCVVTLTADDSGTAGAAASTGDCNGTTVTHWKSVGSSLQLLANNNTLVAWLKPKGDSFTGQRIEDGRAVALNR
jgi:Protease inhibitor Inh